MSLSNAIAEADSTWKLACALLSYWVRKGPAVSARNGNDAAAYARWSHHERALRSEFIARVGGDGVISEELRGHIAAQASDGADVHVVHAAGWALSMACSVTFASSWRDTLASPQVELADGDLFPCCDAPWPWLADGTRKPTSRGASLTNPPDDELPHVRRFRAPHVDGRRTKVTIDFGVEAQLVAVLDRAGLAVGLHPNDDIAEFAMPGKPSFFPIAPADTVAQTVAVNAGLDRALEAGAQIVIAPELSVNGALLDQLAERLDELDQDVLLLAGSRHWRDGAVAVNDATALLPDQPRRLVHRKAVRFTSELGRAPGTREGIDRIEPVHVRCYQAGPYRLAMPICKDLLDDSFSAALEHVGANVVLAPAMSPKTDGFLGRALGLLAANQTLTIMICGPLRWGAETPNPIALRVQPAVGAERLSRARPTSGITRLPIG